MLPSDATQDRKSANPKPAEAESEPWRTPGIKTKTENTNHQKLLFTVKPGGIAGYLGKFPLFLWTANTCLTMALASLCNSASYVDIKAKTDTYVGFLPSVALERLLEKRPIVLLTLAKRLISLLSPLG